MDATSPLKAFRESHDPPLTQADLAKLIGVSRTTVARWETDDSRKVGKNMLVKVWKKTGIHPTELRPDLAALMQGAAE